MSFDLNIYVKDPSRFSAADCEAYLDTLGFHGHFDPDFHPETFEGCLPFVGTADLMGDGVTYRIAPEYYLDEYTFEPTPPRKPTLWERLRGKRPAEAVPEEDPFAGATHSILLSCSYGDSLSILLAYGIAAYAVGGCGGVLYDPQDDKIYNTSAAVETAFAVCLEDLRREKEKGRLCLHPEGDERL